MDDTQRPVVPIRMDVSAGIKRIFKASGPVISVRSVHSHYLSHERKAINLLQSQRLRRVPGVDVSKDNLDACLIRPSHSRFLEANRLPVVVKGCAPYVLHHEYFGYGLT
jgi:hypothetical protein